MIRPTRRGRGVAYAALFSAAFLAGFLLPMPDSAPGAQSYISERY